MKFELPINLMGANKLLRMHWSRRGLLRYNYGLELLAEVGRRPTRPSSKKYLTITRVLGPRQRLFDEDNLTFSCKSLIDAMRYRNLIRDDSPKWLSVTFKQDATRRADGPLVVVEIEEEEN